jgi:hypothetical protein
LAPAKKRPPERTVKKAARKAPMQTIEVPVEDTIIDVVDEPAPGVMRVTEYEVIRTIPPDDATDSGTEDE